MINFLHEYNPRDESWKLRNPGSSWLRWNGTGLYLDHDCKKALESYELGFHLTPNYYPLTKSIVDCQLELNQKQQAIESLNRYMKVVRSGYGHDQASARLNKIQSSQQISGH